MARNRAPRETPEVAQASVRMATAVARRVSAGDIEGLIHLQILAETIDDLMRQTVQQLVDQDGPHRYSYTDVARVLGVSRQAARQRFTR